MTTISGRASVILCACMLLCSTRARAQEPQIPPLSDDRTLVFVEIELGKVDPKRFADWLMTIVRHAIKDPAAIADVQERINGMVAEQTERLQKLKTTGTTHLCAAVRIGDNGTEIHLIASTLFKPEGDKAAAVGDAIVALLPRQLLERRPGIFIVERHWLTGQLDQAGLREPLARHPGAAVRAVVPASASVQHVLQGAGLVIPPDQLDVQAIGASMKWASVGIEQGDQPIASLILHPRDAAAAPVLLKQAENLVGVFARDPNVQIALGDTARITGMLKPVLRDGQVVIALSSTQVQSLSEREFAHAAAKIREQELRVHSMRNLKQIGGALLLYANDHRGQFPDDLKAIAPILADIVGAHALVNPRRPSAEPGYTYIKPRGAVQNPDRTLIAYETFEQWPGAVLVAFVDGHVEEIKDEAAFEAMLARANGAPRGLAIGRNLVNAGPPAGGATPILLFNGKDLTGWKLRDPKRPVTWKIVSQASLDPADSKKLAGTGAGIAREGILLRLPLDKGVEGTDLVSDQQFGDATVELEYMLAKDSNSGVFLQGQYEVQLTDSIGIADDKMQPGDHGGIPWTQKPSANASGKLGEWQTCQIAFRAPRFDDKGKKTENARIVSVTINGKKVQENLELKEPTGSELDGGERAKGPLLLQGNEGIVAFRRIRVTPGN